MKALAIAAALLAAAAAYLLFWPTGMEPVAWTPPPAPELQGAYADNRILAGIQRIASGIGSGPESVNVDAVGRVYTGYADGRIVQLAPDASTYIEMADTGGRPLGITFGPKGGLVIADAQRGLLHLGDKVRPLVAEADDLPLGLTNDADNKRVGDKLYFTDSSSKFGSRPLTDLLEHGANGRLLEYDMATKQVRVLIRDLHYANGVAVGLDDAYVLVCETGRYRILRYWLAGEKKGTYDVFIDNLPGFPDNISFNGRDRFWVALYAPRDALLDALLPGHFFERQLIARLPGVLQPRPERRAFVLGLGVNGSVIANLQDSGRDAYAPISSVREHGPWLYFGSPTEPAIGRLPLNQAISGAPPPPPGWEEVPQAEERPRPVFEEEDEEGAEEREQDRERH